MDIVDRLLITVDMNVKKAQAGMKEIDSVMEDIDDRIFLSTNHTKKFEMTFRNLQNVLLGVGLSFLFTGMAVKNFFQGILQSMFQMFLTVEGESGTVNERVNELLAAVAGLKEGFISAFVDTGKFEEWITKIEKITERFNNLDEQTKSNIIDFMIWTTIIFSVLMVVGQFALGILGIVALVKFLIGLKLAAWFTGIGTAIKAGGFLGLLNLFLALYAIFILLPKLADRFGGFGNFAKAAIAGVLKVAVMLGGFLINSIVTILNYLIDAAASIVEYIAPGSKMSGALNTAADAITRARLAGQGNIQGALENIDQKMGM